MTDFQRRIAIAGAGIAGLSAALALSARGFSVDVFERSPALEEVGAGIQLSPNATRLLERFGLAEALLPVSVEPAAIAIRGARDLRLRASVPLGALARERWGASYKVLHRADLQAALLKAVESEPSIRLTTGVEIEGVEFDEDGAALIFGDGQTDAERYTLAIGADGVGSRLRATLPGASARRETGWTAWRRLVAAEAREALALGEAMPTDRVTTFVHPRFHLVAYPVKGGRAFNLVLLAPSSCASPAEAMQGAHFRFAALTQSQERWGSWPISEVDPKGPWHDPRGLVLIGDAAHAMTPHAAQGAAMAIEDGFALAARLAGEADLATALARFEAIRRPRIERVAERGRFNARVWHASGVVSLGRDIVLKVRRGASLAADLDWLYDHDAERATG
jgi:salicylate hydroxylase